MNSGKYDYIADKFGRIREVVYLLHFHAWFYVDELHERPRYGDEWYRIGFAVAMPE